MPYNEAYYRRHREKYHHWEKRLANYFLAHYEVKSILDLGCGVGSYLDAAYDLGISPLKGYELNLKAAAPYIPDHLRPFITSQDVTKVLPQESFDCVWSVEVGEHLAPTGTDRFISNLVSLTSRLIVLTCAPPGQRGTEHINLRPKEEWIERITAKGLRFLERDVEKTVERWRTLGSPDYILRNLMIFEKPTA